MSERILNSDAELVELFQSARADEAFNRIVLKYQERMYLLARRFVETHDEADDIVQEAFVRAHGALANFPTATQVSGSSVRIMERNSP